MRKSFVSKKAAESYLADHTKGLAIHGEAAKDLTPAEMADITMARHVLDGYAVSLTEAARYWVEHAANVREELPLRELVERFVWSRREIGRDARYVGQVRGALESLARACPGPAAALTRQQVAAWIGAKGWAAKTKSNVVGYVSALYSWAMRERLAARSPVADWEHQETAAGEVSVLTVGQCRELLEEARKGEPLERTSGRLLAYTVLGLFAGIRPAEIERLRWEAVSADLATVTIRANQAKGSGRGRQRRVVDLSPNARAWLALCERGEPGAGICGHGTAWHDRLRAFRARCGWGDPTKSDSVLWPQDAMRHTFASMHYAHFQNEALLQVQMGHTNARMIHQHYRALVTRETAGQFWALAPG